MIMPSGERVSREKAMADPGPARPGEPERIHSGADRQCVQTGCGYWHARQQDTGSWHPDTSTFPALQKGGAP